MSSFDESISSDSDVSTDFSTFGDEMQEGAGSFMVRAMEAVDDDEAEEHDDNTQTRPQSLPRSKRRKFKHDEALRCIRRDYLGFPGDNAPPLFNDNKFKTMFRISRERYRWIEDRILSDPEDNFFQRKKAHFGRLRGPSHEAKILLPLKTWAYGVACHCFTDYFQMSPQYARECCRRLREIIRRLFQDEFLRLPTQQDMKAIDELHRHQHNVPGMFGSLDCCHTFWKNCPVAWQGGFKGAKGKPSIVLEAACDYNLWFWHASYGYAGTNNDISIFNLSPLMENMLNGRFHEIESLVVPYEIAGEEFQRMFLLVDGIYNQYARFVQGIKEPIYEDEKRFTRWQESARKDIERAFGILQSHWQILARPMQFWHLEDIACQVSACLILHNMLISDRVMEDVNRKYDPAYGIHLFRNVLDAQNVEYPQDLQPIPHGENMIGIRYCPNDWANVVRRRNEWNDLSSTAEHERLRSAIKKIV